MNKLIKELCTRLLDSKMAENVQPNELLVAFKNEMK